MADFLTKAARSALMSRVRGRGNLSTEMRFKLYAKDAGLTGSRRHVSLPGTPDFVFRRERICVFVHGCFWHGCAHCYTAPASNAEFWKKKVEDNRARDRRVAKQLGDAGWKVVTVWECQLKKRRHVRVFRSLAKLLAPRRLERS